MQARRYDAIMDDELQRMEHGALQLERVLGSVGLAWDERCLDFARSRYAVKTASVWQVRQPLYQRTSGRARRFSPHLDALAEYLSVTSVR